ncbi:MAG: Uncharacterised protein [Hyphomonas sp. TMED17]|nr:MAG: Uncharacterised protein [Hyphomonas sp. TMED17]
MARPLDGDRYLRPRAGWYYYYRHIPRRVQPFYEGQTIRLALGTQSRDIARMRRDELVEADDAYWAQLKLSLDLEKAGQTMDTVHARKRYEIALPNQAQKHYTETGCAIGGGSGRRFQAS